MRRTLFGCLVLSGTLVGCASTPPPPAPAPAVPMYSNQEWSQMNAQASVPEIPDQQLATDDPNAPSPTANTQSSGRLLVVPITNGSGNTAGSSTGNGVGATAPPPTIRPTIGPVKPKSH